MIHNRIIRNRSVLLTVLPLVMTLLWVFLANSGTVQWFDNGYLLTRASDSPLILWVQSHTSHPFYHGVSVLAYRLAGPHGVAYLNAVLSVPLAICLFWLARTLRLSPPHASLATVAVLLTNNVFWSATKVEVYTLHLLLLLGVLTLACQPHLHRWQRFAMGFLAGLSVCTHQLTLFLLVPLLLWVLVVHPRWVMWALPGFLFGLLPHLPPFLTSTQPIWDTVRHLAYGYQPGLLNKLVAFRFDHIAQSLSYIALLMVSLLGLSIWGLIGLKPTTATRLLWWTAVLNLLFAIPYDSADRFQFFLPGAALFTFLGSHSLAHWVWVRRHPVAGYLFFLGMALLTPVATLLVWGMSQAQWISLPKHRFSLPYRDNTSYFMVPYLKDTSARQFVDTYQALVPTGSMVVADYTILTALRSAQAAGLFQRRDIVDINLLAPEDTVMAATAIHTPDGYVLIPTDFIGSQSPTFDPRVILREVVYVVRFESVLAPWYDLTPHSLGFIGKRK